MATATNSTLGEIRLAGDLAGSNNGLAPELTATGVTAGSYTMPSVTVDAKGRITAASSVNLTSALPQASSSQLGIARPDNSTITINGSGVLSSNIPVATYGVAGICRPDSATLTIDGTGVVSARQATSTLTGIARPDNTTMVVDANGVLSVGNIKATSSVIGAVKPDNTTISVDSNGTISATGSVPIATTSVAGKVKPDNTTISVSGDGTLSVISAPAVPTATSSVLGISRPDNSTITVSSGVLSLATASNLTLGGVKVAANSGLNVAGDGTLSVDSNIARKDSVSVFTKLLVSTPYTVNLTSGTNTNITGQESNVYHVNALNLANNTTTSLTMTNFIWGAEYTIVVITSTVSVSPSNVTLTICGSSQTVNYSSGINVFKVVVYKNSSNTSVLNVVNYANI